MNQALHLPQWLNAGWQRLTGATPGASEKSVPVRDWVNIGSGQPTRILGYDQVLLWLTVGLLALGALMVYSASIAMPDSPKYANYSHAFFITRHVMSIAIAFVVCLMVLQVDVKTWERWAPWIFVIALLLLVAVLIPGIGKVVNKSRRWIPLGLMNFQPSEFAKLAILLYASNYMVRKMEIKEEFLRAVTPMLIALGITGALLLQEPDMGAFVVIAAIVMGTLFLGGVNGRMFLLSVAVLMGTFVLSITFNPTRRGRMLAFFNPWDPENARDKAYQLTNSLIAIGRGEFFGTGLGASVEKLHYLPEAHTDFLLAVIGEELGFIGVAAVVLAFFWMVRRLFAIGRQAIALDRVFAGLYAQGVGIWIGSQAFINMGVNVGLLPTKGLTLPLMSYGGSAILMSCVALAIALKVDIENRQLMRGGRA